MAATRSRTGLANRTQKRIQLNLQTEGIIENGVSIARKTAQGRKATRRGVWDEDMKTELLAFLDYCIARNVKLDAAVTGHMKRMTGKDLGLQRSIKLTMHRLRKAYGMGHVEHANSLKQGTSCLPGLSPERRMKIEQAKNRIPYPLSRDRHLGIDTAEPSGFQESSIQARNLHTSLPSAVEGVSRRKAAQTDIQLLETLTENTEWALILGNEHAELQEKYEDHQRRYKELERSSQPGNGTQEMQGDGYQVLDDEYGNLRGQHEELDRRYKELQEAAHSESAALKEDHRGFAWLDDQIGKACLTLKDFPAALDPAGAGSDWKTEFQRLMGRIMGAGELSALENSIGGRDISELEILRKFAEVRQLGRQEVLRSLASAYVCSVVFEDPFPDVFQVGIPLQDLLNNMDVLGHEAWMSEQKFATEVLCKKSKEMASDLATLLAPILQSNMLNEEANQLEMFPEHPAEMSFQPVFAEAMRLKTQLLLDEKHYRLEFCPRGRRSASRP
ncbi:hypothetical protein DL770_008984 [Monosporascus sp. CRB-9-2]|nr:hypothetical protein DL770_008984 [Monosporascus sp. CRB-9-2]